MNKAERQKIRENSIKKMYQVQMDFYKGKMVDYYDVINQDKTSIPSFELAEKIVKEHEKNGRFNQYGDLIKEVN